MSARASVGWNTDGDHDKRGGPQGAAKQSRLIGIQADKHSLITLDRVYLDQSPKLLQVRHNMFSELGTDETATEIREE